MNQHESNSKPISFMDRGWVIILLSLVLALLSYGFVPFDKAFFAIFWADSILRFLIRFVCCFVLVILSRWFR